MLVLRSWSRRRALCEGSFPPIAAIKAPLNGGPGRGLKTLQVPHPLFAHDGQLINETKYFGRLSWFLPYVNISEAKWKAARLNNQSKKVLKKVYVRMNGPQLTQTLKTSSEKLGATLKEHNIPLKYSQSKEHVRGLLKSLTVLKSYGLTSKRFMSKAVKPATTKEASAPPGKAPLPTAVKPAPVAPVNTAAVTAAASKGGPTCPPKGKQPPLKKGGVPSTSPPIETTNHTNETMYKKWEELKLKFPGWQKTIANRLQQIQDIITKRVQK